MKTQLKVKYRGKSFLGADEQVLYRNVIKYFPDADAEEVRLAISKHSSTPHFLGDTAKKSKAKISFKEAKNGAAALLKVMVGETVPQIEINRRAAICNSCPNVSQTTDCVGCGFGKKLNNFISEIKKNVFKTNLDIPNGLKGSYCKVCSCALVMMLPSRMEAFNESEEKQAERPDFCWVKKTSQHYVSDSNE